MDQYRITTNSININGSDAPINPSNEANISLDLD